MANENVPQSPEALRLGGLLDANHPAAWQVEPPAGTGTCTRCGFLMYDPSPEGLKHLPTEGEFSRVERWLKENA